MSRRMICGMLPALVLGFGLAAPAAGQEKLAAGTWAGTVLTPEGELIDLVWEVSYTDDALSIELIPPAEMGGSLLAGNPVFDAGVLAFTIDVGETISCNLATQDDGSVEGECVDSTGGAAIMSMMPPPPGTASSR